MSETTAFRVAAQRGSEVSWKTALKIPDDPPWPIRKGVYTLKERPKEGNPRRPHMWPPPLHHPAEAEAAAIVTVESDAADLRRKLEERASIQVGCPRACEQNLKPVFHVPIWSFDLPAPLHSCQMPRDDHEDVPRTPGSYAPPEHRLRPVMVCYTELTLRP